MLGQPRVRLLIVVATVFVLYLTLFHGHLKAFHAIPNFEIFKDFDSTTPHTFPTTTGTLQSHTSTPDAEELSESPASSPSDSVSVDAFDGLLNLCTQTNWTEGLWVHCHSRCGANKTSICGGLNNARNRLQTCLRLAIDTGSGVILPSATIRDEENLVKTDDKTVCPDFFWDIKYLQESLAEQCPPLKIRQCDDRTGISKVLEPPPRQYLQAAHSNTTFRELVRYTMEQENMTFADVTPSSPAVISYGDTYIGWNYNAAMELATIRKALFKVLRFNQNLLTLSDQILKSDDLHQRDFIGVHLRGENDWPAVFGDARSQMEAYTAEIQRIKAAVSYDLKTVYVSCGDTTAIQTFRDMLVPLGFVVHDKWTILVGKNETANKIESLSFDQKGILEYQVLVEARFWIGIITSSMSSLVAFARTVDDPGDYFEAEVFPGSTRSGLNRNYPEPGSVQGSFNTKLMVVNGVDIMEAFP